MRARTTTLTIHIRGRLARLSGSEGFSLTGTFQENPKGATGGCSCGLQYPFKDRCRQGILGCNLSFTKPQDKKGAPAPCKFGVGASVECRY